jgi:hypothetical protein
VKREVKHGEDGTGGGPKFGDELGKREKLGDVP